MTIQDAIEKARETQKPDADKCVAVVRIAEGEEVHHFFPKDDGDDEEQNFFPPLTVAAVLDSDWRVPETVPEVPK